MRSIRSLVSGLPRTYWFLFAGSLVNRLGGFVFTFLALYLTTARKMPVDQVAVIVSLYGVGSFVAALAGGWLSDRIGRRATMLLALWGGGTAMLALGFAERPAVIALCTFLVALIQEMYRPAVNAMVSDVVPAEDRSRAFGLLYWVVNLGFTFAAMLGGFMAKRSFLWLFIGDALTTFIYGALVLWKVPETRPAPAASSANGAASGAGAGAGAGKDLLAPFRDRVFLAFAGITLLVWLLFFQAHVGLPIDMKAHGLSEDQYGWVIALNGVMITALQPFASRVARNFRRSSILAAGAALIAAGFGLPAFFTTLQAYVVSVVVWTLGEILMAGHSPAIVSDLAPAHLRGTYQGVFNMTFGLASFLGPTAAGLVLRNYGGSALWLGCLTVGMMGALGHVLIAAPRRRRLVELRAAAAPISAHED